MRDIISPSALFNNTFPFFVSLPIPLPFPFPIVSQLPFPVPILCSLPFPSPFLTALRVPLTLTIVIVIAIARTATCTAGRWGIRLVVIFVIVDDYLIPIRWANGPDVTWFVLPAAWRLNFCP
jgi:hypothetical protein